MDNQMQFLQTVPFASEFPIGWHAILNDFVLDLLAVEYLYGDVVASVGMDRSPGHAKLRVWLLSDAPRQRRNEATDVLDQIHDRIQERARATCSICGCPALDSMVSHCGQHNELHPVPCAGLKPPTNPAWRLADFHILVEGGTLDDVIRTMASNHQQLAAAAAFVQTYDSPRISQILAQAHALRASWAVEGILQRDRCRSSRCV